MIPDLKDPALYERGVPYDAFAELRTTDPVHWNPEADGAGFWAVTRHADIVAVSRNPTLFSSAHEWGGHRIFNENEVGLTGAGESAIGIPFISRDPPTHTRYRKFVMPALSPVRLGDIEARIRARVEALVAEIPLGAPVDIVPLLNAPLPLLTLAELLGVAPDLWPKLYEWTNAFVGEDDPEFRQSPESMQQVLAEFFGFATELFEARRAEPTQDIASLLANAEIDGVPVPFGDFVGNLILVLVGGNETTRNSLSHSMVRLAEQPEAWAQICADPGVLFNGVKEMVRHASPVLHMRRTATADTELGGKRIAKGDKVVLWYASGNRDASVFPDPDAFDLARGNVPHVGFGSGQHVCVGSRLAEMQLRIAFEALAKRVASFAVTAPPKRLRSNFINGLKTLEIELRPA
ncbi:cytochrome P450 [Sphingomonas radiodurans]|uniref:cytochrome P450 n=1 Tax=Sphingomonas radiodurans TaxID=2890321 RepID=UPI001E44A04A|nr:cytochrome P450 [Sphingomonas radiodurans]WBH15811.1 cytochrome P450 [Sphingomonas radiodurans]